MSAVYLLHFLTYLQQKGADDDIPLAPYVLTTVVILYAHCDVSAYGTWGRATHKCFNEFLIFICATTQVSAQEHKYTVYLISFK